MDAEVQRRLREIVEGMNINPETLWVPVQGDDHVTYEGTYATTLAIRRAVKILDEETIRDLAFRLPVEEGAQQSMMDDIESGHHGIQEEGNVEPISLIGLARLIIEDAVRETIDQMYPPPAGTQSS